MAEQSEQYPVQEQRNNIILGILLYILMKTRYVQVCKTYVLVCTNMYQSTVNLWVEGMKAPLW